MRTHLMGRTLTLLLLGMPAYAHAQTVTPQPATPAATPPAAEQAPPANSGEAKLELPKPSQGYFIGLGAYGVGAMAFDSSRGTRTPTPGMGYSLRFGEAITPWLDLGVSFALAWTFGEKEDTLSLGRFAVHSQWYFNEHWFVQAGFGASNSQGADPEHLDLNRGTLSDVYLTGIGTNLYLSDAKRSGGWVLTPQLTIEVSPDNRFTTTAVWLGLEVSWWSGLTPDKLELPIEKAYASKKKKRRK